MLKRELNFKNIVAIVYEAFQLIRPVKYIANVQRLHYTLVQTLLSTLVRWQYTLVQESKFNKLTIFSRPFRATKPICPLRINVSVELRHMHGESCSGDNTVSMYNGRTTNTTPSPPPTVNSTTTDLTNTRAHGNVQFTLLGNNVCMMGTILGTLHL